MTRKQRIPRLGVLFGLLGALSGPAGLSAQGDPEITEELVDRIVAVAGDSIILFSQIQEQMVGYVTADPTLQTDAARMAQLQDEILDNLINAQLIVQAALQDTTIVVDELRLEEIVDQDMGQRVQQLGGDAAMQAALREQGWTMAQFRDMLRQDARRQQLQQQYMAKQQRSMKPIPVTTEEVQLYFEQSKAQFGRRPATVTFRQVVIQPSPSDSADAIALEEAEQAFDTLILGADFEEMARRLSDDEGSKQLGGDLGWFRRPSGFVRAFEDAAFALGDGQVSGPIRTQFGYHLIKVDRIRGPERKARHILFGFDVGQPDVDRAIQFAEELKARIESGESAADLHAEFGGEELPDSLSVPTDRLGELPQGYSAALTGVIGPQVIGPIVFGAGARANVAVLEVIEVRDEGEFSFEDLEEPIRQRLQQQKILEELVRQVRDAAYVDIR